MKKAVALSISIILIISICACSSDKMDQVEVDMASTKTENEGSVFEPEEMISFSPMETSGNSISDSLECVLTDRQEAENIELHMQNVCETQPSGGQFHGDGILFFKGVTKFAEDEQLQSFEYSEDTSIIVRYDPSVSFSYTISVYRESDDGLRKLDETSDHFFPDPGNYLLDICFHVSRDDDYCTCDALFWMRCQ